MAAHLVDPLLWQSSLTYQSPANGIVDRLRALFTRGFVLNFLLPLLAVIIVLWVLKSRYDQKRQLYQTYVPAYLQPDMTDDVTDQ